MSNPANNPHITPASNVETSDEGFDEAPWNSPKGRIGRLKYLGMVLAQKLSFAAWFLFYSVFFGAGALRRNCGDHHRDLCNTFICHAFARYCVLVHLHDQASG